MKKDVENNENSFLLDEPTSYYCFIRKSSSPLIDLNFELRSIEGLLNPWEIDTDVDTSYGHLPPINIHI